MFYPKANKWLRLTLPEKKVLQFIHFNKWLGLKYIVLNIITNFLEILLYNVEAVSPNCNTDTQFPPYENTKEWLVKFENIIKVLRAVW